LLALGHLNPKKIVIKQGSVMKKRRKPQVQAPRVRINRDQKDMLEAHYLANPNWSNQEIQELADSIGVNFTKVYKWNWERKKKEQNYFPEGCDLAKIFPTVRLA